MEFKLRPWQLSDADSLVENGNNFNIAQFMTDGFPYPYTKENAITFINHAMAADPVCIFAIDVNGKAVGGIGIHQQQDVLRKNAELGYWLGEQYWGNGVITRGIQQIVTYAFKTFDIVRIYARPYGNNIASQKVLLKAGFLLEATISQSIFKNGEFLDELIFAIRK